MHDVYPVTIISTRYGGAYEDALWAAFNCHDYEVPKNATGCDISAFHFWTGDESRLVGRGDTPDEALADLTERLNNE